MEWFLPAFAMGLILAGTAIGAYITYSHRKNIKETQDRIEEAGKEIDLAVSQIKTASAEIIRITSDNSKITSSLEHIISDIKDAQDRLNDISKKTKNLVTDNIELTNEVSIISEKIQKSQIELKQITDKTGNLVDKNVELTEQTKEIGKQQLDFLTGGSTFLEFDYVYYKNFSEKLNNKIELYFIPWGSNPLRNLEITIVDNLYKHKKIKRQKIPIKDAYKDLVVKNNPNSIMLNMGDVRTFLGGRTIMYFDNSNYNGEIDFTIRIESDNWRTIQRLIVYDYEKGPPLFFSEITKYSQVVDEAGQLLLKVHPEFPLDERGNPISRF